MTRGRFKIIRIEHTAEREEYAVTKIFVATKVHNIDVELGINFVSSDKIISVASIGITKGGYDLLARAFLLKDANELHNGFQSLMFRINNPTILVKETMLSVTWEQFADRIFEWIKRYMVDKLSAMHKPIKEMLG